MKYIRLVCASVSAATSTLSFSTAEATPQFARTTNMKCISCHALPPMLNARGQDFWQRGYRLAPEFEHEPVRTAPFSAWITARREEQVDRDFTETFVPKVELISGGPIGDTFSYFIEWRTISLESGGAGQLRDRSGRFEDAYLAWSATDRFQVQAGQFRSLTQTDVSRRLSITEPAVFGSSLAGDPVLDDGRRTSLRAFSPSGRQPGLMFQYQSAGGKSAADGLFHSAVLPFVGEWSLPVTPAASEQADFVSEGPPKGVFVESFYRVALNSIGAHGFLGDDRWLFTIVGTINHTGSELTRDLYLTGALGWDDNERTFERTRSSIEMVYIPRFDNPGWLRTGLGLRAERVTGPRTFPAYIPYVVLSLPNDEFYTLLTQIEYRYQENNRAFFFDVSLLF